MPNPFKDWARMNRANKDYLESQGRPSSFFGQIGDIPNRMHEAADATEIGVKMMRHLELTNGAGLRAAATVEGVWQVGSYLNMSPVLRIQARVVREDETEPYVAVFDEVVAQLHIARVQLGAVLGVAVDPQNPMDMAIDWIRTGQLGPPPPGSTPGPGAPGRTSCPIGRRSSYAKTRSGVITIGTENSSANSAAVPNRVPIRSAYFDR